MSSSTFVAAARALVLCGMLTGWWATVSHGQDLSEFERSRYSPAAYYNYAEPGDLTILVNIWGTVRNPGRYEVPEGTSLSTLLSVAGGPTVQERQQRTSRSIQVRLHRPRAGRQTLVYEATMEDALFATEEDPELQPGDVLTVDTVVREAFSWRDAATLVSVVSSLGVVVLQAIILSRP